MGNRGPMTRLLQQRYDALKAERAPLARELEDAKAERDEIKADLAAAGALLSPADPHVSLPAAIAELQAELARMRPVVEAALNLEVYPPYVTSGWSEDKLSVFVRACQAYRDGAGKEGG